MKYEFMKNDCPISVVIPCYNSEKWISRAIESVLAQEDVSVEVTVIDDGSTDHSLELIRRYGENIRYETGQNRGACAARNRGLELASHPFIMFLDADDFHEKGTLAGLASALVLSGADFALSPVVVAGAEGRRTARSSPRRDTRESFIADWIMGQFVPPCGILWRTEIVKSIGGWNEALRKNQDGDLVLRAILSGAKVAASEAGTAIYWQHESEDRISNSISDIKLKDSLEVLRHTYALVGKQDQTVETAFSIATHSIERLAAQYGCKNLEHEVRLYRQAQGWPPVVGSFTHVAASRLLGLRRKEVLARGLRSLRWR